MTYGSEAVTTGNDSSADRDGVKLRKLFSCAFTGAINFNW
ncbi:hypothetical protein A2U01_0060928, partial [Trifolium medium]|nr:hypothetical protein [Trifolium medium]